MSFGDEGTIVDLILIFLNFRETDKKSHQDSLVWLGGSDIWFNDSTNFCFFLPAEEDEEQTNEFVQKVAGKAKSTHDVLDDPKLSKETATFVKVEQDDDNELNAPNGTADDPDEMMAKIRNKLKSSRTNVQHSGTTGEKDKSKVDEVVAVSDSDSDEFGNELEKQRKIKRKKKA